jgi:hypothetical protein
MNLGLVKSNKRSSSEDVYAGFVPKMRPPASITLNQIKGYQIYLENYQIAYMEHDSESAHPRVGTF